MAKKTGRTQPPPKAKPAKAAEPVEHTTTVGAKAHRDDESAIAGVVPPPQTIKVRALKDGFYDNARRRTGDVFKIRAPFTGTGDNKKPITIDEFSEKWMEKVDPRTPEKVTTGKDVLRQQHDEILEKKARTAGASEATGAQDVL